MLAAFKGDITLIRQAMLMDPLTDAVCTPAEILQLVDEMLIEEASWLSQYKEEIKRAKERFNLPGRILSKDCKEMRQNQEEARKKASEADKAKNRPAAK